MPSGEDAVVVEAVRAPQGRRGGVYADLHPTELLGQVLTALIERTGIDPALVDDLVGGCCSQVGEQSVNVTRNAWLGAGLPESVPATTVDRQCGSSQQAIHFAAQGVMAGAYDVVIACGVESMTRVPMLSNTIGEDAFGPGMRARYGREDYPQGISAEMIAARWEIDRESADRLALNSHRRAAAATDAGSFEDEIVPIAVGGADVRVDEGIRRDTSLERLGKLKPAFYDETEAAANPDLPWIVTAGNASQIADGAAALLIMSADRARQLALTPRWRFRGFSLAGTDPVTMLTAPIPATQRCLERAGMTVDEIDHFEINEAFATVVGAWSAEFHADPERVNPRGGAIALGHPTGASGARLMTTMMHALEQQGGRFGLQSMCEGGGLANATLVERLG